MNKYDFDWLNWPLLPRQQCETINIQSVSWPNDEKTTLAQGQYKCKVALCQPKLLGRRDVAPTCSLIKTTTTLLLTLADCVFMYSLGQHKTNMVCIPNQFMNILQCWRNIVPGNMLSQQRATFHLYQWKYVVKCISFLNFFIGAVRYLSSALHAKRRIGCSNSYHNKPRSFFFKRIVAGSRQSWQQV